MNKIYAAFILFISVFLLGKFLPENTNSISHKNAEIVNTQLSSENEDVAFVIVDAEKFPESRKLADVSNLPTFATFVDGKFLNQTQTNKFDVLKDLVNQVI